MHDIIGTTIGQSFNLTGDFMAKVIDKQQCPQCLDSGKDNLAVYDDQSKYCFGCGYFEKEGHVQTLTDLSFRDLKSRAIEEETCRYFNYQVGRHKDEWVQVANYVTTDGKILYRKLRTADKKMWTVGPVHPGLYGQWLYSANPNLFITITEGEIDTLSVAQATGLQFPVVSIPKGANNAQKAIEDNLSYLLGFKYVVLAFDNDAAGKKAANDCLHLFEPGQVRVATWTLKDANEMLQAGMVQEIKQCLFNARVIKPDSVVGVEDILDKVLDRPSSGLSYPWPSMTDVTYGLQMGEIHIIVAGSGVGKTEFIKDMVFHFIDKHDFKVGMFSFEQAPDSTLRRLIGAKLGIKLHLPGAHWNPEEIKQTAELFKDKLFLYDKAGRVDHTDLFNSIRYLTKAKQCKFFIIDNIKALGIAASNDLANEFMNRLKSLVKELNITVQLVSHVAKDKIGLSTYVTTSPKRKDEYESQTAEDVDDLITKPGTQWENGRIPNVSNIEGSNIIVALSDYVFALARNRVSQDAIEQRTTIVKVLKARLDSSKDGKKFKLYYNDTGKLTEMGEIQYDTGGITAF